MLRELKIRPVGPSEWPCDLKLGLPSTTLLAHVCKESVAYISCEPAARSSHKTRALACMVPSMGEAGIMQTHCQCRKYTHVERDESEAYIYSIRARPCNSCDQINMPDHA